MITRYDSTLEVSETGAWVRMKTPKQRVKHIYAYAVSDYYESMPSAYFIRVDIQGKPISDICASPRLAWLNAYLRLRKRGILA